MQPDAVAAAAIRRLLDAQVAAWNAGDAQAWCKDHTPDAAFVNILGMRFTGAEANARRHAELFAGPFKDSRLVAREVLIRVLAKSVATADFVLELTGFRGLPPGIRPSLGNDVLLTRMHCVLVRTGRAWRVVFSQNTAVMPVAAVG